MKALIPLLLCLVAAFLTPGSAAGVTADPARLAYKKVASSAGALRLDALSGLPVRDEVDSILIEKLLSQTHPFHH